MVARAYPVLETATVAEALPHLRLDVRAGAAYFAPQPASDRGLVMLGCVTSKLGWTWREAAISDSLPSIDISALHAATEATLCE